MSNLYKIIVKDEPPLPGSVNIRIEATNNEDQVIPKLPLFYFAVIGSIYWALKKPTMYGYGLFIDEPGDLTPITDLAICESFISTVLAWNKVGVGQMLDKFAEKELACSGIEIVFKSSESGNSDEDNYRCASAEITLNLKNKHYLEILKKVKKAGIAFSEEML